MSTPSKLLDRFAVQHYDFDPDATTATEIAWVDMRDREGIAVSFTRTIGTGAVTFKLMANTASDGSGTDVDIVTHAVASEPDAVGDQIWLETSALEIATKGSAAGVTNLRYLTAVVSVATGTDEGVVSYFAESAAPHDGVTADIVA